MDYFELKLILDPIDPWGDLISADLGEINFESFEVEDNQLRAYVSESDFDEEKIQQVLRSYKDNCDIKSSIEKIETINWNKEWEKNFEPIFVEDKIVVKSSFHDIQNSYEYEILIDPKMSFGTGHHATTYLVMERMLEIDFQGKDVLDMGCGTAVLAILAKKKGARKVVAIDIDEWAYENSRENLGINDVEIEVFKGGAELLGKHQFNVILANINLNILVADMSTYVNALRDGGTIIFSGVLEHDKDKLKERAVENGLTFVGEKQRNKWMMLHFNKGE